MSSFLVTMSAVESRMPNLPSEMLKLFETKCAPALEMLAQAETDGRVFGGVHFGARRLSFFMRGSPSEVEEFTMKLPLWSTATTEVTPLTSFSDRLALETSLVEEMKKMCVEKGCAQSCESTCN